ncbi:MAG TPA: hypothetical protein VE243_00765, partial [Candidatus Acidoferrum sp.]|nr:hypothetical protein [Candidatus Acidoferrum sp.]
LANPFLSSVVMNLSSVLGLKPNTTNCKVGPPAAEKSAVSGVPKSPAVQVPVIPADASVIVPSLL